MTFSPISGFSNQGPVDLSKAVRPFVDPIGQPTRNRTERGFYFGSTTYVAPSTTDGQPAPGQLVWKATQSAQVSTLEAFGFTVNWPDDPNNEYSEIVRTTHTQRVENPDDPSQYVDIEIADSIQYKNTQNKVSKYQFSS